MLLLTDEILKNSSSSGVTFISRIIDYFFRFKLPDTYKKVFFDEFKNLVKFMIFFDKKCNNITCKYSKNKYTVYNEDFKPFI
jgi:hypothetical protein